MKKLLFLFAITAAAGCTLPDLAIDVDLDATLPDGWTLPEDVQDPPPDGEEKPDTADTSDTQDSPMSVSLKREENARPSSCSAMGSFIGE